MRILIYIIFLLILFCKESIAQNSAILSKKINVKVENESLRLLLTKIEKQGEFTFSFGSTLINADSLVSHKFINTPICDIIDQLFNNNVDYKQMGDFVILRPAVYRFFIEADEIDARKNKYIIKGKILDSKTGLGVKNASVYERRLLKSTLTDRNGQFDLTFKGEHKAVLLTSSKEMYRDTSMFFLSDIKVKPEGLPEKKDSQSIFAFSNIIEESGVGGFLVSSRRRIQSLNISEFFVNSRMQTSFLPGFGSQGFMSSQIVNTLSFNLLGGYSAGVQGFEAAGMFNLTKKDVKAGVQIAGLLNQVGGDVSGLQMTGGLNLVHGEFRGFQMAGVSNQVIDDFSGIQVSGVSNLAKGNLYGLQLAGLSSSVKKNTEGAQVSGLYNYTGQNLSGFQLSGIVNKTSGQILKGMQISGIVNIGKNIKGVQMGLVNIADSISGVGIGLVNIYKSGYKKLSIYTNEVLSQQFSYKSGNRKLYSIIEIGTNLRYQEKRTYNLGLGFGHDIILTPKALWNLEFQTSTFFNKDLNSLGSSYRIYTGIERKLVRDFGFVAGLNYQFYGVDDESSDVKPYPSWVNHISSKSKAWAGLKIGLVYDL